MGCRPIWDGYRYDEETKRRQASPGETRGARNRRGILRPSGGPRADNVEPDAHGDSIVVPREATETISYGIPAFKHNRVLVWYAAFADHCSLFPTGEFVEAFSDQLAGFKISKERFSSRSTSHCPWRSSNGS